MLIETNLLLKVLIFEFLERWVRYKETILGSDGKEFKPCLAQKAPKSLKSDLYALKVLFAFELLNFLNFLKFHLLVFLDQLLIRSFFILYY